MREIVHHLLSRVTPRHLLIAGLLASPAILPACQARRDFPDPKAGYHNASYTVIFGRLVREQAANPDDPATWVVRFGAPTDPYKGELALDLKSKPEFVNGYAGGE